jgi:hypothetical protein
MRNQAEICKLFPLFLFSCFSHPHFQPDDYQKYEPSTDVPSPSSTALPSVSPVVATPIPAARGLPWYAILGIVCGALVIM